MRRSSSGASRCGVRSLGMILLRVTGCRTDDPLSKLERSYDFGLLRLAAERLDIPLYVPGVKPEHPEAAKVKKRLLRRVRKVDGAPWMYGVTSRMPGSIAVIATLSRGA
ncbi:hypothetical protein [Methanopyrus sp.]